MALEFIKHEDDKAYERAALFAKLPELVKTYDERAAEVERLEEELRIAKDYFNEVSMQQIPEIVHAAGLSELRLEDGRKITVKESFSAKIKDESRQEFFTFLEDREETDIIKLHMAFTKMPDVRRKQLIEFLTGYEYDFEMKEDVHYQTLQAYMSRLLGFNLEEDERKEIIDAEKDVPFEKKSILRKVDVEDFCEIFTFFTTKIKDTKKKSAL